MIAILIPTYNRAQFLGEAIESVQNQDCEDAVRIIVYDDGSTDNTSELVRQYDVEYIRSEENHGVGYARNRLLDYIDGMAEKPEFVVWQDSDDVSHHNRLRFLVSAIRRQQVDVVFSHMYFFTHPSKHYQSRTLHKIDVRRYTDASGLENNMNFATSIFNTSLIKFRFDESKKRGEDVEWLRELIAAGKTFGYIPRPLYYCRRHENRLTYLHKKGKL